MPYAAWLDQIGGGLAKKLCRGNHPSHPLMAHSRADAFRRRASYGPFRRVGRILKMSSIAEFSQIGVESVEKLTYL
jgi:hypothetical protein